MDDKMRKYFSVREVAEYLSISRSKAYDLIKRGDIQGHRFGKAVRVSKYELLRFERESNYHGC